MVGKISTRTFLVLLTTVVMLASSLILSTVPVSSFAAAALPPPFPAAPPTRSDLFRSDVSDRVVNYDQLKHCTTDLAKMPSNPTQYLTYFNCGHVSQFKNGTTLREFSLIIREDKNVSITMGNPATHTRSIQYRAWTFNGTVPGPTMRMTEGDLVKIKVINQGTMAHSLHMHSIHPGAVDGTMYSNASGSIPKGKSFTYEFTAAPAGLWPYHCHMMPISLHIGKGLYGAMIIDPVKPRQPKAIEMVGIMNGFDLGLNSKTKLPILPTYEQAQQIMSGNDSVTEELPQERDNQVYALNTIAFYYDAHPIQLKVNKEYRLYLVNMLDFDFANQFHMHGQVFQYYPSGMGHNPNMVNDIVTLGQGDRGILEFMYRQPGLFMIHSHFESQSGRGWEGLLSVK